MESNRRGAAALCRAVKRQSAACACRPSYGTDVLLKGSHALGIRLARPPRSRLTTSPYNRRLVCETLEARTLLSAGGRGGLVAGPIAPPAQEAELALGAARWLGQAVAMSGNTIVAGSTGGAEVYGGSGTSWSPEAALTVPNAVSVDFGFSVSISGNTVVVGAPNSDGQHGAAYVFVEPATGWANTSSPTAVLTASDGAAGDDFGTAVAISGNTVVVGAENATVGGNSQQGAAYVFVEAASGWTSMTETAKLTSSDGQSGDAFGTSVSISGATVAVVRGRECRPRDGLRIHGTGFRLGHDESNGRADRVGRFAGRQFRGRGLHQRQHVGRRLARRDRWRQPAAGSGLRVHPAGARLDQRERKRQAHGDRRPGGRQFRCGGGRRWKRGGGRSATNINSRQGEAYEFAAPATGWTTMNESATLIRANDQPNDFFGGTLAVSGGTIVAGAAVYQ